MADPRVHKLLAATSNEGGVVAVLRTAEPAFAQAGLLNPLAESSVLAQGGQEMNAFIKRLVNLTAD